MDIEFGHFIINQIQTLPNGPSTVPHILEPYKDLINQAKKNLNAEAPSYLQSMTRRVLSLCRALIQVAHQLGTSLQRDSEGFFTIEQKSPRQNVLIVRTWVEDRLSKPLSFESMVIHTLPLAGDDIPEADDGVFAMRISLPVTVKFIADLEHEEEALKRLLGPQ